ncbi:MAG: ABC transporter permease [Gottschalkiaceae bacterium]|nr:MAG: ABC transporter permease [Gottschalkiaceae bacterium]
MEHYHPNFYNIFPFRKEECSMIIFKNNITRILRKKSNIIFMIILPILTMVISLKFTNVSYPPTVGIIDRDNTELTSFLINSLENNCEVVFIDEDDIKDKLIKGAIEFAINIPNGFTENIITNKESKVNTYKIKDTEHTIPLSMSLNNNINSFKNIARATEGDYESFYKGLDSYKSGNLGVEYKNIEGTDRKQDKLLQSFGFIIMFMMYLSNNVARLMLEDKRYKTYARIFCSPISSKSYMLQNILSFITIIFIQVAIVFTVATKMININLGSSIKGMFLLLIIFGVCSVAMAVAINILSKDMRQGNVTSQFIILPMSLLGGCFWPREIMPKFLQQLARFIPVTWTLEGIEKLLFQPDIKIAGTEIIILILFSTVFFLLGLNRRNNMEL